MLAHKSNAAAISESTKDQGLIANSTNEKLIRRSTTARFPVGGVEVLPLPIRRCFLENWYIVHDL